MPPVSQVTDQNELVDTSKYKYAKFPFDKFNPVQSRVFEYYDKDTNALIAAATSAGKTVVAEMFMAHEVRERRQKAMYLAPLRALAQEKIDDWGDKSHHFSDLNLSICTGDYRLTAERRKELESANVIMMTSEMLNSRCRNYKSEHNNWLKDIGTLVIDESHLLTVPGRGDHLEAGLMKFSEINPGCRLILLSATMPNVNEIADWVSYQLTGRDTFLLKSSYRPCPLLVHWEKYYDGNYSYEDNELEKISEALKIVDYYPEDKFLIFTHTKRTGDMMKRSLEQAGVKCEFHNADLDKSKRNKLEKTFREDPKFRVIVATSTLAWGLNLPARRVIILGVHRGMTEVAGYDIWQMAGRAGRPKYDPAGDVYILLPESSDKFHQHKSRLKQSEPIRSQMLETAGPHYKVLAFHLVSQIHHGDIKSRKDMQKWFERSLAHWQANELQPHIVEDTINLLVRCGAVKEEEGVLTTTSVGTIASMFYFSPFDVADLKRNFAKMFEGKHEDDDYWVSMALGNMDTHRAGICSKAEREEMGRYLTKINQMFGYLDLPESAIKAGFCYYQLMNGGSTVALAGVSRGLQFDYQRLNQVILALDSMAGKWNKKKFLQELSLRVMYGVKGDMAYLCQLPNIGKVRAERLYNANLRTIKDVAENPEIVKRVLNLKAELVKEVLDAAEKMKGS